MKIACSECKKQIGEKEPFEDPSETHGKCMDCLQRQGARLYESGFVISAWIDLLGQRRALEKARPPKEGESAEEHVKVVFGPAFGAVIKFRKSVRGAYRALTDNLPSPPEEIARDRRRAELYKKYTQQNIQLQFIADSAILRIPLTGSDAKPVLMSIWSLLYQLSINMLNCLANGMPARGGIAVGWCTQLEEGIYGQADSRALWAEAGRAKYPRIIIHRSLLDYLTSLKDVDVTREEKGLIASFIKHIQGFMEKEVFDGENDFILSYLSDPFKGDDEEGSTFDQGVKLASKFIAQTINDLKKTNDIKLLPRYEALKNYFERHGYPIPE